MDMNQHISRLFAYDDWANREVLVALESTNNPPARSLKLLAHILSAERLWLERLLQEKQSNPVWPEFSMEQCKVEAAELPPLWKKYLASMNESTFAASITYTNTKGESFSSQRQDILIHVTMHSAYHRGQIAADMRAAGRTPPLTDFIHAVRQGFVD